MTPDDGIDRSAKSRDADRLNAYLDQLARGHRDDGQGLEPSLLATVEAVASLASHESEGTSDPFGVDQSWTTLMATLQGANSAGWRDRGVKLGLGTSPAGFPWAQPSSWPMGLASAVAAVLLVSIVASHYAGLPGSPSTSTVMADGAPTVVSTETVVPAACLDDPVDVLKTTLTIASETAPALTTNVGSTAIACVGSQPRIVDRKGASVVVRPTL